DFRYRVARRDGYGARLAAVSSVLRQCVEQRLAAALIASRVGRLERIQHFAGTDDELGNERVAGGADSGRVVEAGAGDALDQLMEDHLLGLLELEIAGVQPPLGRDRVTAGGEAGIGAAGVLIGAGIAIARRFELRSISEEAL